MLEAGVSCLSGFRGFISVYNTWILYSCMHVLMYSWIHDSSDSDV